MNDSTEQQQALCKGSTRACVKENGVTDTEKSRMKREEEGEMKSDGKGETGGD